MRRSLALLSVLALAACADDPGTPLAPAEEGGPRGYIVVFKDDAFDGPRLSVSRAIADYAGGSRIVPRFVYSGVLEGFAADLALEQVAALRADPRVAYVEPDAEAELFTTQTTNLSWGLDRIDDVDLPLDGSFTYFATGASATDTVTAYILDTGVTISHAEFAPPGRAEYFSVGGAPANAADCIGHGTHVAGIVGGVSYGVAKAVKIRALRVISCSGTGTASMVIAAMDSVRLYGTRPAVVLMALGYGNVTAVKNAAANLVAAGYVVVAAAGNGNSMGTPINACNESPGNAPVVLTVGATNNLDKEASFSNHGPCVDLLAPGVGILSANYASVNQVVGRSGTSMAAAYVAGVAAQYLQNNTTATPATVASAILGIAKLNTITLHALSTANGTPNRFLFTNY